MIIETSARKSGIVQKVLVRRGENILGEWLTRSLIDAIREGKLERTDEFSGDGLHWSVLGEHHQLKQCFPEPEPTPEPPGFRQQLGEMAALLEDINSR